MSSPFFTMLQALLHSKLNRWLTKDPFEIEDLLTSTVFGSCSYVSPEHGLLPFLSQAVNAPRGTGVSLSALIGQVSAVEYDFWPSFDGAPAQSRLLEETAETEQVEGKRHLPPKQTLDGLAPCIPELLLKFKRPMTPEAWVLVEAKLFSGKSSHATSMGSVSDQLGKYWLQLQCAAQATNAVAVGILYVTQDISYPSSEFRDTQRELQAKNHQEAPLFWVSWRAFGKCFEGKEQLPIIIQDVISLLRDEWGLAWETMDDWPVFTSATGWAYSSNLRWPTCSSYIAEDAWTFLAQ